MRIACCSGYNACHIFDPDLFLGGVLPPRCPRVITMNMERLIPMLPVRSMQSSVEYHKSLRENGLDVPDLDATFYGMVEFRLDDPDGNRLWIGQDKSNES